MDREKIDKVALFHYSKPEVQKAILKFCENRETVPRYFEVFGKRPDLLQYPGDIISQVRDGATSFHCSEEIWHNPLEISTELSRENLNQSRKGWDLLIDIDSKYLDYSAILAELLIEALKFHGIKNVGIKFSGSKGFHIIVPSAAFPEQLGEYKTSTMFPEWPRAIVSYLHELIKPKFVDRVSSGEKSYVKDFEAAEKVMPDLVLVSSRHLFRTPYSLHEKTALVSMVLDEAELKDFNPNIADPLKVKVRDFMPTPFKDEARELLIQALDWQKAREPKPEHKDKKFEEIKIDRSRLVLPPSISKILEGMKDDGRKRALFILINFFRHLDYSREELESKVDEWNKKNSKPLKIGYIKAQLDWAYRNKKTLPPNYDKPYYKDIGVVPTEEELRAKNPISYVVRKQYQSNKNQAKR